MSSKPCMKRFSQGYRDRQRNMSRRGKELKTCLNNDGYVEHKNRGKSYGGSNGQFQSINTLHRYQMFRGEEASEHRNRIIYRGSLGDSEWATPRAGHYANNPSLQTLYAHWTVVTSMLTETNEGLWIFMKAQIFVNRWQTLYMSSCNTFRRSCAGVQQSCERKYERSKRSWRKNGPYK